MQAHDQADRSDLTRLEQGLEAAVARLTAEGCPPRLARALRHATLGRGHRLRPRLLLAVCRAVCGRVTRLAVGAATALELLHCASLVHDDLPCFDDADTRRGAPSVHGAFGEATAVLTGDALIVGAFDVLTAAAIAEPRLGLALVGLLAGAAGSPRGIAAGQGWESEPNVDLDRYHQAKTASLFEVAAMAGAVAGGAVAGGAVAVPFGLLGRCIGRTYQLADDLRDCTAAAAALGKPVGRDAALGRPSAVRSLGLEACAVLLEQRIAEAAAAVPACAGRQGLVTFVGQLLAGLRA